MSTGCATVSGVTASAHQDRPGVKTAPRHSKAAAARRRLPTQALYIATLCAYLPIVSAEQVCHTTDSGDHVCKQQISTAVKVAIGIVVVTVVLLALGVFYFIRRFRSKKQEEESAGLDVEPSQIEGPPATAAASLMTTYAAKYDPSSAPVRMPSGSPSVSGKSKKIFANLRQGPSTAPTGHVAAGGPYPFQAYSSKNPPPRSLPTTGARF
ncbi:hypothetical protein IW261DRAFT_592560 [Armillaria novae-zelandiae]|uniref:Transmembrane protein n=1 Tax=Armillaria novae-zelandiae TaxID=153914 RepID=A0AA39PNJ1_9AGAR|nr:hypothetical protein IW261DRAFT_592560 [Armillaria novae-zelandiae]